MSGWTWLLWAVPEHGLGSALALPGILDPRAGPWSSSSATSSFYGGVHWGPDRLPVRVNDRVSGSPGAGPHFLSSSPFFLLALLPLPMSLSSPAPGPWHFGVLVKLCNVLETLHQTSNYISYMWKNMGSKGAVLWAYQTHKTLYFMPDHAFIHSDV